MLNVKELSRKYSKEILCINKILDEAAFYEVKEMTLFFKAVEDVLEKIHSVSEKDKSVRHALRLYKGNSKKFYEEMLPFDYSLKRMKDLSGYKVRISDDSTPFDAVLLKDNQQLLFEITTTHIDQQDVYRMYHLNHNGNVGAYQTFRKTKEGFLEPEEDGFLEVTRGKDTETLIELLEQVQNAIKKKQGKDYQNTQLIVCVGHNSVLIDNPYAIKRVREIITETNNKTFQNIFVLDYNLDFLITGL